MNEKNGYDQANTPQKFNNNQLRKFRSAVKSLALSH